MPFASAAAPLGASLSVAAGSTDTVGIAKWGAIAAALCVHVVSSAVVLPGALVASGSSVVGVGLLTVAGAGLPAQLALAAGTIDAVGVARWAAIASAVVTCASSWTVLPTAMVAPPAGGPVTGAGTVKTLGQLGAALAVAAGSIDAVGVAKWVAIGAAIEATVEATAVALPTALVAPPGGGPITGVGSIA